MNAAALIVLILFLIGAGTFLYYSMLCWQVFKPKRRKSPANSDMGPLLNYEDFNGNHEEPVRSEDVRSAEHPEASAPKPEEDDLAKKDGDIELPVKSVSFQNTPECASIKPSSKKGSIALDIDEEPPVLDNSKSVLQPSQERFVAPKTTVIELQKSHNEIQPRVTVEKELPYNPMSNSYEEDGLLVPESQSKNLHKEPRKRLHAQRSAPPEGYIPHQQLFVQRSIQSPPKNVQFANPQSAPVIVMDSQKNTHQTVRPKLKSPLSDPGTSNENIFIFGITHESETYDGKPVKKVKVENEDICGIPMMTSNQPSPSVGWVINLPHNSSDDGENKNKVVLNIEDAENQRSATMPLATSEIDCGSVRKSEKVGSPGNVTKDKIKHKIELDQMTHSSDSDCSNSDDSSNIPSREVRLRIGPQDNTSGSDSSEPDLTEYSFEKNSRTPDPAISTVLQNEISCFPENKIGLTNYVAIPDTPHVGEMKVIENTPPTPTSDAKSVSPLSSNDNSLEEIKAPSPSFNPTNVLGTPPQTPPVDKTPAYITDNPSLNEGSPPSFIVIEPHRSQRRNSSDSVSSSLSSSSSSSNGSYKLDSTNNETQSVLGEGEPKKKQCF